MSRFGLYLIDPVYIEASVQNRSLKPPSIAKTESEVHRYHYESGTIFSIVLLATSLTFVSLSYSAEALTDLDILNFALNLEYLEANFYSCAARGKPISKHLWGKKGVHPKGCTKASLSAPAQAVAMDLYKDEETHVKFLQSAIKAAGGTPVHQPLISLGNPFAEAANAAFNTTLSPPFTPYADDVLFYHGAFIFEDVGVTAYHGAINAVSAPYLTATSGLMGTEAYHAGAIRTLLINIATEYVFPYGAPVQTIVQAISNLRAMADGTYGTPNQDDQGIINSDGSNNLVPSPSSDAIPFSRTPQQVLDIVYLGGSGKGGFFPNGMNGKIK
ncbi:hypothetical protein CEUSTIGMA_g8075.t1 [Chlamydomonas eustigma]|uniref:Desiccation-related protein PCC13-62 n=1 Tax=Chlamydomonas eustigma TaxID=1157962 RepID=A0A250XD09_9CHLO|nr:hypothetical protein CEUSTIGMA_g8075.t1 [Chlamydomonas eustigma]|eukprot:GAX80640.1 hypothetical protein CEUSTIGMA_g8075.t1 [Chlamydomonas eustigma]